MHVISVLEYELSESYLPLKNRLLYTDILEASQLFNPSPVSYDVGQTHCELGAITFHLEGLVSRGSETLCKHCGRATCSSLPRSDKYQLLVFCYSNMSGLRHVCLLDSQYLNLIFCTF